MKTAIVLIASATATLALAGCATLEETLAEESSETYYATLTGANEVGGGDSDGYGRAEISITDEFGQICWDLNDVRGIGPITAAHIHLGAAGTNGPPVFTLRRANEGGYKGCTDGSEWQEDRIEGNPEAFYVNVHTAEYPNGAIRGQLSRN
ncbi:CHRD domain-containing protein [Erythrobacter sp. SDW2]|uniref:CHRD domain-containing protein n=1 Tax=Erythrobacter sp. SDW2 TaxID=2907154 RepID=UPI001F3AC1D7|nr:CHRD domain-containing protein [Erythrobacter sp. SDW2]UIP07561.1 CHRD domain-containing protein [Erythrobacter sp. SDW2]